MRLATIIARKGINDDNKGKKHALHKLIEAADADYVWLQDDDVIPPSHTPDLQGDMIILPLRMEGGRSLVERLQIVEYAAIQELTMRMAKRGKPVMCSGANMIVKRTEWLNSWGAIHEDIPSGDDMFVLEDFKRRGLDIRACDDPNYTALVYAQPTWRAFLKQRMRWAGKAPAYTDKDIRRVGAIVLAANMLQIFCPLIILMKFPFEYALIKKRDPKASLFISFILELLYPWYIILSLLGGIIRRGLW